MINHVRFSSGRKEMNRRYQKSDYTVTSLRASEQASLSYIKKYLPLTYFKVWNELSRCWSWAISASCQWASSQLWLLVSSSSIDNGTFIKKKSFAFKFGRASDASDGHSLKSGKAKVAYWRLIYTSLDNPLQYKLVNLKGVWQRRASHRVQVLVKRSKDGMSNLNLKSKHSLRLTTCTAWVWENLKFIWYYVNHSESVNSLSTDCTTVRPNCIVSSNLFRLPWAF